MLIISPHVQNLARRLRSLKMQNGDMSYRMEGICQAISDIRDTLTDSDCEELAGAVIGTCRAFNQIGGDNKVLNRFAAQTLVDLAVPVAN